MTLTRIVNTPVFDNLANAVKIIDSPHSKVHDGFAFHVSAYDLILDADDVLSITFKIPNISTKRMHFTANGDCTSGALFEVLEGPTITGSTGVNKTILNRDRDSENQSMVLSMDATANTVTVNATVTHDGTIIEAAPLSAGKSKIVGQSRGEEEWLLKTNSLYTIRITGLTNGGIASINLNWYEHTSILRPIGN